MRLTKAIRKEIVNSVIIEAVEKRNKQLAIRAEDIHAAIVCAKTGRKCK